MKKLQVEKLGGLSFKDSELLIFYLSFRFYS